MKELKKLSLKSIIVPIIVLWGVAAVFLILILYNVFAKASKAPLTLAELDYSSDLSGVYIEDTLYGIYDYYCETTSNSRVVSREYLIDAGSDHLIGLLAKDTERKKADALMNASWDYLDGKDDGTILSQKQYEISGVIRKMPSDSLKFYKEFLMWDTLPEENKEVFLQYYIVAGDAGGLDLSTLIILGLFGSISFFCGMVLVIKSCAGSYQKSVKNYLATCPNKEMASERIDYFVKNTEPYHGVRINSEFICAQFGADTVFGALDKLVWAYEHVTTHRTNFIVTGHTYQLALGFMDGKKQFIPLNSEQEVLDIMRIIADRCPHIVLGYTDELQRSFSKDMNGFLQIKYQPTVSQFNCSQSYSSNTTQQ